MTDQITGRRPMPGPGIGQPEECTCACSWMSRPTPQGRWEEDEIPFIPHSVMLESLNWPVPYMACFLKVTIYSFRTKWKTNKISNLPSEYKIPDAKRFGGRALLWNRDEVLAWWDRVQRVDDEPPVFDMLRKRNIKRLHEI